MRRLDSPPPGSATGGRHPRPLVSHLALRGRLARRVHQQVHPAPPGRAPRGGRGRRGTGRHLPDGPAAFRAYFDGMVEDRLERNATVDQLMRLDREPLPPPPFWPLPRAAWTGLALPPTRLLRATGIASLPPVLRARFGLRWSRSDQRRFEVFARGARLAHAATPAPLRVSPVAARALRSDGRARGG
ncbi:oxygenase MpaB family protein [Actinomadura sp. NPDC049753]|uniref:oxygenase MpaB family protein n=1 Tax=Actinomadura sp. NPDC049753 TaxID=3154739 RepID=UPI0034344E08